MFHSEVEEWLYSIGLPQLYPYFMAEGFDTLDKIRNMRQSDIDAIVDRNGYMMILNEEIDRLNFNNVVDRFDPSSGALDRQSREQSYLESEPGYETRESLISKYEHGGVPAVGFASRHFARRAKSKVRKDRSASIIASRASIERYIPNSASNAYEDLFLNKRAASVAAFASRDSENAATLAAIEERQREREAERQKRAKTGNDYKMREKKFFFYKKMKWNVIIITKMIY